MSMHELPKPPSKARNKVKPPKPPCPFCGSTRGMMDLHGSITCTNCNQKVEGCCGGSCGP